MFNKEKHSDVAWEEWPHQTFEASDVRCICFIFASRFRIHISNFYLHQKLLPASWCWHTCIFGKIWELALKAVDFHSITLPEPYQPLHSVCVWLTWKPLINTGGRKDFKCKLCNFSIFSAKKVSRIDFLFVNHCQILGFWSVWIKTGWSRREDTCISKHSKSKSLKALTILQEAIFFI